MRPCVAARAGRLNRAKRAGPRSAAPRRRLRLSSSPSASATPSSCCANRLLGAAAQAPGQQRLPASTCALRAAPRRESMRSTRPARRSSPAAILGAMTLTANFAPVVILAGHGSSTRNNPHAAGLDCGACCGQTGEINVRVLAQVLNDDGRARMYWPASTASTIPADTRFVAGLHDTTTDDAALPDEPARGLRQVRRLAAAPPATRRGASAPARWAWTRAKATTRSAERSRDWSQVRPEWGLAGNACFIVAPRSAHPAYRSRRAQLPARLRLAGGRREMATRCSS
jgi:hypothetical protein